MSDFDISTPSNQRTLSRADFVRAQRLLQAFGAPLLVCEAEEQEFEMRVTVSELQSEILDRGVYTFVGVDS